MLRAPFKLNPIRTPSNVLMKPHSDNACSTAMQPASIQDGRQSLPRLEFSEGERAHAGEEGPQAVRPLPWRCAPRCEPRKLLDSKRIASFTNSTLPLHRCTVALSRKNGSRHSCLVFSRHRLLESVLRLQGRDQSVRRPQRTG